MIASDFFWMPLVLIVTIIGARGLSSRQKSAGSTLVILAVWHSMMCFIYIGYASSNGTDASMYYTASITREVEWGFGTPAVILFSSFFTRLFKFGYVSLFLIYNMMGVFGICILFVMLTEIWPYSTKWAGRVPLILVFMPGLSFWTSAIGKDAPAFLAVCLACFAVQDLNGRKFVMLISIALMVVVRPHIAAAMLTSLCISVLVSSRGIGGVQRILIGGLGAAVAVVLIPAALKYSGLGADISSDAVLGYIDARQGYNVAGGSSIDLKSLPLAFQILSYLYRPLLIDANGIFGIVASIENLVFLAVSIRYLPYAVIYTLRNSSVSVRYNILYITIVTVVLATTTANLGIAVRQKTMILPSIYMLIASSLTRQRRALSFTRPNVHHYR